MGLLIRGFFVDVTLENFRGLRLEGRALLAGAAEQFLLELGRDVEDNGVVLLRSVF